MQSEPGGPAETSGQPTTAAEREAKAKLLSQKTISIIRSKYN